MYVPGPHGPKTAGRIPCLEFGFARWCAASRYVVGVRSVRRMRRDEVVDFL
jgi:hypothetical protein